MTNHWVDLKNADVIMINGSNAAENHPASMACLPALMGDGDVIRYPILAKHGV